MLRAMLLISPCYRGLVKLGCGMVPFLFGLLLCMLTVLCDIRYTLLVRMLMLE